MTTSLDVAAYIVNKLGPLPAMKLHKLVYYAQAWSLVWDGKPLFRDRIKAWVNGPVVPRLYRLHRGRYEVSRKDLVGANARKLTPSQKETIDVVIAEYGDKGPQWLSELTHREQPWRDARKNLAPLERGDADITNESMYEYYDGLLNSR